MTFELKVKAMFEGLRRLVCVHGEWVEGGGWGDLGGCSFCVYVCGCVWVGRKSTHEAHQAEGVAICHVGSVGPGHGTKALPA